MAKMQQERQDNLSPPANGAPRYSMAQAKARPMPVHPFPQLTTRLQQGTAEHRYSPKCPPSLRQGVPDRSVPGWPGRRLGQCQGCAPSCAARTQQAIDCHSCIHKGKSTCATASTAALAAIPSARSMLLIRTSPTPRSTGITSPLVLALGLLLPLLLAFLLA